MGLPPVSLGGVQTNNGSLLPKHNLKVPQLQFIDMGGLDAAIDTGNDNCVFDPNVYYAEIGDMYKDASPGPSPTTCATGTATRIVSGRQTASLEIGEVAEILLNKASGGASPQGEQYAIPFSILPNQKYKINRVQFDYSTSSGYVDGDMRVYIYDDTNGVYLSELSQRDLLANEHGTYSCDFQTADGTDYYIVLHCAVSTTVAWTMRIGNFYIGRKPIIKGAIVTDWKASSLTTAITNTNIVASYERRVGSDLEIAAQIQMTGTPAGTWTVTLPSGYTIDSTKVPAASTSLIGEGIVLIGSTRYLAALRYSTSTTLALLAGSSTAGQYATMSPTVPGTFAASDYIWLKFRVPITGWASNVVLSEDTGNRDISFMATGATSTSLSTSGTTIPFDNVIHDTTSSYNPATGIFTAPESGKYTFTWRATTASVSMSTTQDFASEGAQGGSASTVFKGNSDFGAGVSRVFTSSGSAASVDMKKGDTFRINGIPDVTVNCGTSDLTNHFSGFKIQTPQTIGQSEVVSAEYSSTASGLALGGAGQVVPFATKKHDTHNAYNTSTGVYTIPVSGKYFIGARINTASFTPSADTNSLVIRIRINGSDYITGATRLATTSNTNFQSSVFDVIDLQRGNTVDIYGLATDTVNLTTTEALNRFSIAKIG
jgi:hypothetical protein